MDHASTSHHDLSRRAVVAALLGAGALALPGAAYATRRPGPRPGRPRPAEAAAVPLSDDGTDQSAVLQAAIDAAPDGSVVVLPGGRFRLDRKILVANRKNLTIAGPAAGRAFVGYTNLTGFEVGDVSADGRYSYRQHWQVVRSSNVTLRNIGVVGPNTRRFEDFTLYQEKVAFEHAFCINGPSQAITVDNCTFSSVNGDGIYVGGIAEPVVGVNLSNIRGEYPGRQSLGITNVDGLVASLVTITGGGRSGVDIEPNGSKQYVRNVVLDRLDMGSRFYPYVIGGMDDVVRRENITLTGCTAHNSSSSHPAVLASRNGRNLQVIGHVDQRQGSLYGIIANKWSGVSVQRSWISSGRHTPKSYGVRLTDCEGLMTLYDNSFNGAKYAADELFEAAGTTNPLQVLHSGNSWAMGAKKD